MDVEVPQSIEDITLGQYKKYHAIQERTDLTEIELNKRIVSAICALPYKTVTKIVYSDLKKLVEAIEVAINTPTAFEQTFTLNGVEYGFIPNLDEISTGEFVDLQDYGIEIETLNNVMAILFRPITNKDKFGNYVIELYNGTKQRASIMNECPLNIVNGAMVFFYNLSNELQASTQRFLEVQQAKEVHQSTTLKSGVGTQL